MKRMHPIDIHLLRNREQCRHISSRVKMIIPDMFRFVTAVNSSCKSIFALTETPNHLNIHRVASLFGSVSAECNSSQKLTEKGFWSDNHLPPARKTFIIDTRSGTGDALRSNTTVHAGCVTSMPGSYAIHDRQRSNRDPSSVHNIHRETFCQSKKAKHFGTLRTRTR